MADDVYQPGSPIFLFDGGEADASAIVFDTLQNESSPLRQVMRQFKGMGIVWEHRYYGGSLPGDNLTVNTDQAELQYLTVEQALEDVAYFARNFTRTNHTDLGPDKTPWVFVGASYPGARAAWMRNFYPDVIFASYAASAPVQARVDFSSYYDQVYRSMVANGFGNCTKDIHAAVNYIDQVLDGSPYNVGNDTSPAGRKVTALKESFLGRGYGNGTNFGLAVGGLTWDIPGDFQYYGLEGDPSGYSTGIRGFCDYISTDPKTGRTSGSDGWAKEKGAEWTTKRWASYGTCADGACETGDGLVLDSDSIAWTWQTCTQLGYYQTANLGPHQLSSKYNSLTAAAQMCQDQFSNASVAFLPASPDVDGLNARLGGWTIRPSNVYWSNGEFDPWRSLSPMSTEPFSPNYPVSDTPVPGCLSNATELANSTHDPQSVFGYVLPNAEHGFDLGARLGNYSEQSLDHSHRDFSGALKEWLKCFQPGKNEEGGTAGKVGVKPATPTSMGSPSKPQPTGSATTATPTTGAASRDRAGSFIGIVVLAAVCMVVC